MGKHVNTSAAFQKILGYYWLAPIIADLRRLILYRSGISIKREYQLRGIRAFLRKSSSDKSDVGIHAYAYPSGIVSPLCDIVR